MSHFETAAVLSFVGQMRVFERWARLEPGDEFAHKRDSLQHLSRELEQQLHALVTNRDRAPISDKVLTDFYTMLGSVRGLIEAMANAQAAINQINWQQWTTPT